MKITKLRTLCLSRMHEPEIQWFSNTFRVVKADCVIVVIETDEGVTGIGEACAYGGPEQIKDWVSFYNDQLCGRNPLDGATPPAPHFRSSSHDCAVAGIDCAIWDIRGKVAGKSVAQLLVDLGLSSRTAPALDRVPLYASAGCNYDWRTNPRQVIAEALDYISRGFGAMKLRIGTFWAWDGVTVDTFLGLIHELHAAVKATSKPFGLAVDANQRLTIEQAVPIAQDLDRLGFIWFEEPIPQADRAGYARLAAAVNMPITGGEQFTTLEQFRGHLDGACYDIVQPDVGWCGITEALKIARAAEKFGVRVIPHNWHNGLMTMANAHFVAALRDPRYCELCMIQGPLQWAVINHSPTIQAGELHLPNTPGLGVELAENLEETFPYITGSWGLQVQREDLPVAW